MKTILRKLTAVGLVVVPLVVGPPAQGASAEVCGPDGELAALTYGAVGELSPGLGASLGRRGCDSPTALTGLVEGAIGRL